MTQTEQLVELQNGVATTTSLQVAETFGKRHENVLKAIDNIIQKGLVNINETLKSKAMAYFELSEYINEQNHQTYRMYKMNQKGFTLLAGGFTDKKFMEYKVMFVEQFDAMQHYIQEQQQTQFFAPETVEQQIKREQLAIAKQNSDNAKSREVRSWLKLTKNNPEAVNMAAPKVMSLLLGMPEERLHIEPQITYLYTAGDIGKMLGLEAYDIGSIAQRLDLKATREEGSNRYTKNVSVKDYTGEISSKWLYSQKGFKAIADYLDNK